MSKQPMKSESFASLYDSNLAWLSSNLGLKQRQKLLSYTTSHDILPSLSHEDFDLQYTCKVIDSLKSPRRISFLPVEATFNPNSTPKTLDEASCSSVGSTEFSLLTYLFSAIPSYYPSSNNSFNPNLLLLGSCSLPAVVDQVINNALLSKYQTIILAESSTSSFLSILNYIDFPDFIRRLKELNISFHLFLEDTYELLTENIYDYFSKSNPFLIFGLDVVIQPLLNPILVKVEDWVLSQDGIGYRYASNLGFSTDELNQSINSFITYHRNPLIKGFYSSPIEKSNLSVVTGSGPSLDENLDWIKSNESSLTIFAAGSSVRSLLSHGIKPSFLVVQERNPVIYDYLLEVLSEFPELSDITLLGSDSIDSRNFTLFDRSFIFQRPLSSVSPLFYEFRPCILPTSGPESVNACTEAALMMGSSNILLLGCDFAAPNKSLPRSKNAFGLSPRDFDIPVRGNQQRTVYSQLSLLHAKQCLERVLEVFPTVNVVRSGEGVSFQNEKYVTLSNGITPADLCDSHSVPYPAQSPQCKLSHSSDKRISDFVSSFTTYISSLNQIVQSSQVWDRHLESSISDFFLLDLKHQGEPTIDLAARRLLRHCFYHLTHQLYLSRSSETDFAAAKAVFESRSHLLIELLTRIFNTLKSNIDFISSSSEPLNELKQCLSNR